MQGRWGDIVNLIPVREVDDGMEVKINGYTGLVFETPGAWILMLSLKQTTLLPEMKWITTSCLLLSAYSSLGCGLSYFNNRWWLSRRYSSLSTHESSLPNDAMNYEVSQQVSLAGFIETWPTITQHKKTFPVAAINSVSGRWC